jgi:hypothetical protein
MVSRPVIRAVLASPSVDHLTSFFFFSYQCSRAAIATIVLFLGGKDKKMEKRGSGGRDAIRGFICQVRLP